MLKPPKRRSRRPGRAWQSGLVIALALSLAILLLQGVAHFTRGPIEAARAARLARSLDAVLPGAAHDNEPLVSARRIPVPEWGPERAITVYPLRQRERTTGIMLKVTAPDGYSGPIQLVVGLSPDGEISGVRVLEHRETPGLGDAIEHPRSDWIEQFDGRTLDSNDSMPWRLRRGAWTGQGDATKGEESTAGRTEDRASNAGEFDALTGATVTSAAIVHTVRDTLAWFERNREAILRHD